jgi:hypothetical protein
MKMGEGENKNWVIEGGKTSQMKEEKNDQTDDENEDG